MPEINEEIKPVAPAETIEEVQEKSQVSVSKTTADLASMVADYAKRLVTDDRAKQFATTLIILARKDDKFAKATPNSLMAAMMACVYVDLLPNTPQQHAHLIPYFNSKKNCYEIQFQIGYPGLLELAYRSAQVRSVSAELVFEGDKFTVKLGTQRDLIHEPKLDIDRTNYDAVTHAYATAKLVTGESVFEILTREELDKVRNSAKAKSTDTPWDKWPEAMAKKTALKRLIKLLPKNKDDSRLDFASKVDSWAEAGNLKLTPTGDVVQAEPEVEEDKAETRAKILEATKEHGIDKSEFKPKAIKK